MLKKLFTHSFLYGIAPQIPKIVTLFMMPIFTAHLSAEDYGIYGVIISYVSLVSSLKDLGFSVVFANSFYKNPLRWRIIWRMLHGHLIIWSLFYSIILFIILYMFIPIAASKNTLLIILLLILSSVFFEGTTSIGNYYFRFTENPIIISIISIFTAFFVIAVNYYCIVIAQLGYMSWFVSSFLASFLGFLIYFYPIYIKNNLWPIIRWRKKFITPYLRISLPMIPHNYSSYLLNSSDRVVLSVYNVPMREIGFYNISYQFGNYMESFGEAVGMATGPFFSKLYTASQVKEGLIDARRLTFFLMTCFLSITFLTSLWLKEIFYILIKKQELQSAYNLGIIILMGYSYRPMYWSAGIKLSISESTGSLWKISFVGGLINVLLNLVFIPIYGVFGAAISTFISLMYLGFSSYFFKSYRKTDSLNHYPILWMILIISLTFFCYQIRNYDYLAKAIVSFFVLLIICVLLKKNIKLINNIKI